MKPEEHEAPFVRNGSLCVGDVELGRLSEQVGSTPFFAYDRAKITARVAAVRSALPADIDLGFAVKANPMPALVQHLSREVDWLDVASAGEMQVALDAGTSPARVSFAGPGKTDAELRRAVAAGVLIELESATEARRAAAVGGVLGIRPRVAVRVNPDFTVKGSGMRMGGGPQQFGVDVEQVPGLLEELRDLDVAVEGFHVFAGSQNLQSEILVDAQRRTVDLVLELAAKWPDEISYLNLGGGFGIPYFERDRPLDLRAVGDNLRRLVTEEIRPAHPTARVVIELGRYLVGEAGIYVTRVVDRKTSRDKTYLVVDGGMHHQLAASGNFGQVIRRNYPIAVGEPRRGAERERVTVVGSLCTPLDLLGDDVDLPHAEPGDLIVLFQAGAYGLTASPTRFLGHPEPAEIVV
ncbi:pyridoxal-dependent decarboxylase, exosortase A system-associated [Nocardioides sp. MAH-18]|uniref:Pyridoxal-dependent decarboxylase, exosortase A system-associated n=1 Tax=Nocardioides agri TaxID=2682843 RepID=A0A6L6XPM5_9ACTN|nr:pyridoxal-dependent decarboxylase, exosortase A system-associated [Nocardioides sp. CGMCC 1.13656]MBA2954229.1 pyridoxal-dependent decarboxylase, exosortase A system-associated [Nocardioides sp. CGMCC 1.13656]MVQ49090.1 pyridoxal-dependent decarboxylase, exosortase A system-associated [Nocardioides sp. MAH-18]